MRIATGEHVANRVIFKQLLAAGAISVCQIDACRVAGVNENIAVLLLAAKFGVPVCPHAGGVGLCELVQHLAMFDFVAVGASLEGRWIEYVDHLHEHFAEPVRVSTDGIGLQAPQGLVRSFERRRSRGTGSPRTGPRRCRRSSAGHLPAKQDAPVHGRQGVAAGTVSRKPLPMRRREELCSSEGTGESAQPRS